jgi:myo-inositol-1(or 4)-monophosphatase
MKYRKYQKIAEKLAKEAGKILLEYQQKATVERPKRDSLDITTNADLASEGFLVSEIHRLFPRHNIITEESEDKNKGSEFTWIIDPLDGTKEYLRGLPFYGVSIALDNKGEVVVGALFRPATGELFSASKGSGAFLNGKRLFTSSQENLSFSFIMVHLPTKDTPEKEAEIIWNSLRNLTRDCYRLRTTSEDNFALSWLAQGAFEGYILPLKTVKWWDVASGLVVAREAGAKITSIFGSEIKNQDLSNGLIASNGKIHQKLVQYIAKRKRGL